MHEPSWKPLFRSPRATVTKVLQSPAFLESRERAAVIVGDSAALRALADAVQTLDHDNAPLSAVSDRVAAAVRLLRARADELTSSADRAAGAPQRGDPLGAGGAARERLIVAALIYLITPVDLVPDVRPGGYIDDVLLLTWVFGAAVNELEPFLEDQGD